MDVLLILLSCVLITTAEHSGAYSSPQYAKKFYPGNAYDTNGLLPREKTKVQFRQSQDIQDRYDVVNDTTQYGRSSTFLETAGSLLSGAGGHVVSSLAKDFIARSTGSSQVGFDCITQVLSLNLTNLVILIVLKALIMAAGFFGAGAWRGHNYARSIDDNKNATYITGDEIRLYLSYLIGQNTNDYDCLYQLSCLNPHQAGPYSSAAELLLQGAVLMNGDTKKFSSYEEITQGIRTAAQWGEDGMSCARYQCGQSQTHT